MKKKKRLCLLLVIFIILLGYSLNIYATDSIITGADKFLAGGNNQIINNQAVKTVSDTIFNIFISVGSVIVVIIGAILGIKFMVGSVEEKAEIKESIKPYAWGAIVIFGAVTIWYISVLIFQNIL